jgi:hypothetical protein
VHRPKAARHSALFVVFALAGASIASGGQARPSALSAELRAHVQAEDFQPVTSLRGLPLGVREGLIALFGTQALDIAEPGAAFRSNGVVGDATVPVRRMALAGCSYEHCLVYYERGGAPRTWRVALFRWSPEATRLEAGGIAPGGLTTVADLRRTVLGGVTKSATDPW